MFSMSELKQVTNRELRRMEGNSVNDNPNMTGIHATC
jgi:hypothetical protein